VAVLASQGSPDRSVAAVDGLQVQMLVLLSVRTVPVIVPREIVTVTPLMVMVEGVPEAPNVVFAVT
jgi:hypothetical protein